MRIIVVFLLILNFSQASADIILADKPEYKLWETNYHIFEDQTTELNISEIINGNYAFQENSPLQILNPHSAYWIRFSIKDHSDSSNMWMLEVYNNTLDNLEFYLFKNSILVSQYTGATIPFSSKFINHKNYIQPLLSSHGDVTHVYIRAKASDIHDIHIVVKRIDEFIAYSLTEYITLGLFYGFLLAIILFNLFIYFYLKNSTHLFYSLYVLFFAIYSMAGDSIGFQYIWPEFPWANSYIYPFALCFFIVNELLFVRAFNINSIRLHWLSKAIGVMIALRIIYLIAGITLFPALLQNKFMYIDLLPFALLIYTDIYSIKRGFKLAYFLLIGTLFFLAGFLTTMFMHLNLIESTLFTVYARNFGMMAEIMVFFICLALSFKIIKKNKDMMESQIILQKKEVELIEKNKALLKNEVLKRTKEIRRQNIIIEKKNHDMDSFLYKSSHNLRGPLKTVEGICSLGQKESQDEEIAHYFTMICDTVKLLDEDLFILREIATLNQIEPSYSAINTKILIEDVEKALFHLCNIKTDHTLEEELYSDRKLLKASLIHLIEASHNISKSAGSIHLQCYSYRKKICIDITICPPEEIEEFIINDAFQPFNINLKSKYDINFELYTAKMLIEKVNGKLNLKKVSDKLVFEVRLKKTDVRDTVNGL